MRSDMTAVLDAKAAGKASAEGEGLTRYVADFVAGAALDDLPQVVVDNGKKSILDGLGLALRSEERRVGKECVSTSRSRRAPAHLKKKKRKITNETRQSTNTLYTDLTNKTKSTK